MKTSQVYFGNVKGKGYLCKLDIKTGIQIVRYGGKYFTT